MVKVRFVLPWEEKEISVPDGGSILQAAALAGVPVEADCGGKGTCGKCGVKILSGGPEEGASGKVLPGEKKGGRVLACREIVRDGMVVQVEAHTEVLKGKDFNGPHRLLADVHPLVEKVSVVMNPPTVTDQAPDLERLLARLPRTGIRAGRGVLAGLPGVLRRSGFRVTATLIADRLVAVEPGDTTGRSFGLALDVGTTTLVGYLLDLNQGRLLATASQANPQRVYGADVISRINHASSGGLKQLQSMVLGAANQIVSSLLEESGVLEKEVYEAVVVGNTTMTHLFLGVDPSHLAFAPFTPAFKGSMETRAGELGLRIHPEGRVVTLPGIAGHVGSDTLGVILATGLDRLEGFSLAVDIGTNGEIVLAGGDRLLTCSTAAGPAFEGGQIEHGMRAAEGAIESVEIGEDIFLRVIGNSAPRGICGSGLIDAVAGLLRWGLVDRTGRLRDPREGGGDLHPRLRSRLRWGANGYEFILAPGCDTPSGRDIVITQKDLRELQLAKGAIKAGISILLKEASLEPGEITRVFLAGAFGNYIRKESALALGLIPEIPPGRIFQLGNAAGEGAMMALVSGRERARAAALAEKVEHVELSVMKDFQEEFIKALNFSEGKLG